MRAAALLFACLSLATVPEGAGPARAGEQIFIGAGEALTLEHHLGRAICRLVSRHAADIECKARPTPGGLSNLANVRGGAIELGIVASDLHYHAVNRSGPFRFVDASYDSLRSLFSVNVRPLTVVINAANGPNSVAALKGRRVNIGDPGSPLRFSMNAVMTALGWTKRDFLLAEELPRAQQFRAFCHRRVEATGYITSHPDAEIEKVVRLCDAALLGIESDLIGKVLERHPYFVETQIPAGTYAGQAKAVRSFGVVVTVVSSVDVDAALAYRVVRAVFDNIKEFKAMHPVFAALAPERMASLGLSAPLHAGARRYYLEQGLQ